jgi:hypothetical protein
MAGRKDWRGPIISGEAAPGSEPATLAEPARRAASSKQVENLRDRDTVMYLSIFGE